MWPDNLDKDVFLKILYGDRPDLQNIEVTRVIFSRDGPSIDIGFYSDTLPKNAPKKWKLFNIVSFYLSFSDVTVKLF